jgi:hypothetical protein
MWQKVGGRRDGVGGKEHRGKNKPEVRRRVSGRRKVCRRRTAWWKKGESVGGERICGKENRTKNKLVGRKRARRWRKDVGEGRLMEERKSRWLKEGGGKKKTGQRKN